MFCKNCGAEITENEKFCGKCGTFVCRKDAIYASAKSSMTGEKVAPYETAIQAFQTISGWKDADEQIYVCRRKIEEIKAKEEAERLRQVEIARKAAEARAKRNKKIAKKIAIITTAIVCVAIAFVIVLNAVVIPTMKYNDAVALINNDVVQAYEALIALNGYKDSAEKAASIYENYKAEKLRVALKVAQAGDYVFFGVYEQDNDTSNGRENIEWLVLAKEDNKILVISKYALDCRQYNTSYTDVTWETCSLRNWLNNDFLNTAFTDAEKSVIPAVTVSADKNPNYSTNPGNATQDKIFLLSITEVEKYFSSNDAGKCVPTDYALAQGAFTSSSYFTGGKATCWWWLRSPGTYQHRAAYVDYDGLVGYGYFGLDVNSADGTVRPALWITLDS